MSLDLSPDIESRVLEYAAAQGVSINELMARTFPPRRQQPDEKALQLIETIRMWQAEDETEDADELNQRDQETSKLHQSLDQARRESGMRLLFPNEEPR